MILDDDFANRTLAELAARRPAVLAGVIGPTVSARIREKTAQCLALFDKHRGFSTGPSSPPPDVLLERQLLIHSLKIIGKILNLEEIIPTYTCVVEADWLSHIELEKKERRYRDHITHPARVTAIGWWLLHWNGNRLLNKFVQHYRRKADDVGLRALGLSPKTIDWPALVENAWLAAGLLHDTAYPLEYHLRTGHRLQNHFGDPLNLFSQVAGAFSSPTLRSTWLAKSGLDMAKRCQKLLANKKGAQGSLKKFKNSHALAGATHHLLALDVPGRNPLQILILRLAARAIATHHDDHDSDIISDPLAWLLFIADGLQAWRRTFMHRLPPIPSAQETSFRFVIECDRMELVSNGDGYIAKFHMAPDTATQEILKNEYEWAFDKFAKPNQRIEKLMGKRKGLPKIELAKEVCIQPASFRRFMNMSR